MYQGFYHPEVNVLFQGSAWADTATVTTWAKTALKQHVEENLGGKPFLLYQGNLKAQKDPGYQQTVRDLGGLCVYGPRGMTEGWQPIDAAILIRTKAKCTAFAAVEEKTFAFVVFVNLRSFRLSTDGH